MGAMLLNKVVENNKTLIKIDVDGKVVYRAYSKIVSDNDIKKIEKELEKNFKKEKKEKIEQTNYGQIKQSKKEELEKYMNEVIDPLIRSKISELNNV